MTPTDMEEIAATTMRWAIENDLHGGNIHIWRSFFVDRLLRQSRHQVRMKHPDRSRPRRWAIENDMYGGKVRIWR
jgi:hypothetical protein